MTTKKPTRATKAALSVFERLQQRYPDADCELVPRDPFQLLVAVVLSAQTTDVAVNRALPGLFGQFPGIEDLAKASAEDVQPLISSIGMYRQKAKNIVALSQQLLERHGANVPRTMDELVALPGVGRKTANVVLAVAFGITSGVVVDTHVQRLAQRLGWTKNDKPEQIEKDLCELFPRDHWIRLSHLLIFHGRRTCTAKKPDCVSCVVADQCPSAGHGEDVGRKPSRRAAKSA